MGRVRLMLRVVLALWMAKMKMAATQRVESRRVWLGLGSKGRGSMCLAGFGKRLRGWRVR